MTPRHLLLLIALAIISLGATKLDLLIHDGRIIDGAGNAWFYGDVGISSGKIVAVGDLHDREAARVIDAKHTLVVAPGFIDVHTHADDDLFRQPKAENFVRDGVTTIVTGNCGYGVADVRDYFEKLKQNGVAINVATLYGHNTILKKVKGDRAGELTDAQMEQAKQLLDQAMRDGAVGMSTGLIYTPGTYSKTEEIIELQKVAAKYGGIYASHMRSEGVTILAAIDEALRVGREANCRVEISHFKLAADVSARMREADQSVSFGSDVTLKKVLDARAAGQEVWMDQYPYTASSTTIATMLPDWVRENGDDAARKLLRDETQLTKVLADMKQQHEVERRRKSLGYAVIASCRAFPQFVGKNLEDVARWRKAHPSNDATTQPGTASGAGAREGAGAGAGAGAATSQPELLASDEDLSSIAVTMDDQYRAVIDIFLHGGASCVFHSMAEPDVENILRCPLIAVASDSGVRTLNAGMPHPRGYGTNARVLGLYVRERRAITLEDAVRKMTSLPATAFRFRDRGQLREGFRADVTIFDADRITDKATFEKPHAYSEGVEYVIVNGQVVLEPGGTFTGAVPGEPIYGPGKQ